METNQLLFHKVMHKLTLQQKQTDKATTFKVEILQRLMTGL